MPGELCPGAPCLVTLLCWGEGGGGSVARDTSSLVNGLWGNRSPGVVTKAREIA